jgi:polyphosphate kinase
MAVDSSRPFPLIRNKTLNIAAILSKKNKKGKEEYDFATVQVPSGIPRILMLPDSEDGTKNGIFLEQVIERNLQKLFLGHKVVSACPYRIMRNADLTIDEEDAADLLKEIEKQIKKRQWGEVIRLEVEEDIDKKLLKTLRRELMMREEDIYYTHGPLDLTFLMKAYGTPGFDHLKEEPYEAPHSELLDGDESLFAKIRQGDILLNHPFDSFDPVVAFVKDAASDPKVLAIKQTLYRVSGHSPIVAALAQAAENGKQVSVLVELKARFDEENNIGWARKLEQAGAHVIYGLVGLKTHCKITLVVRKEDDGIRRYVHLGTGNYNDSTAKLYTDMGMFTCDPDIGEDATAVFNMLSGYSEPERWKELSLAPIWLRDKFMELIQREQKHAEEGREARIVAKMNSLCDQKIIAALYKASAAGVKIDLIIRGICCLKTDIPGVSENITVRSIVGTFLEHSRIFYFKNDGDEEIYMGSADWMPRNLDRRVEILFPVKDPKLKSRIKGILKAQLKDTAKARVMQPDGSYRKSKVRGKAKFNSQMYFCEEAIKKAKPKEEDPAKARVFIPRTHDM